MRRCIKRHVPAERILPETVEINLCCRKFGCNRHNKKVHSYINIAATARLGYFFLFLFFFFFFFFLEKKANKKKNI